MDEAKLKRVKQQIEEAFEDAPYPGDHEMVDDLNDWESIELMSAFKGKHWKELDAETLRRHGFSFLSIAGLQYYFPAYLIAALDNLENILDFTVYGLCLINPGKSSRHASARQWQLERFNSFTPTRKGAIKAFLEYVRDEFPEHWLPSDPEPARALKEYWGEIN